MTSGIADHYGSGDLLKRLKAALVDDGVDPEHPTIAALAPYDQFHGRGLEATEEVAAALSSLASDHILDIGSGFGGPARFIADRYGCRVTGIDLTQEFCETAAYLTDMLGLGDRVTFDVGSALAMPYRDQRFDAAYSMNVAMNIADKAALYGEIFRVLKPGARLVLAEIARGTGPDLDYPTPWARSAETSFLSTPEAARSGLEAAGFIVVSLRDTLAESAVFGAQSRELVARGEKPPHRAVHLVHGDLATTAMTNSANAVTDGRAIPIEILCRKRA